MDDDGRTRVEDGAVPAVTRSIILPVQAVGRRRLSRNALVWNHLSSIGWREVILHRWVIGGAVESLI